MTHRVVSPKAVHFLKSAGLVKLRVSDDLKIDIVDAVQTENALCIALLDGRIARVSFSRLRPGTVRLKSKDFKRNTFPSIGLVHGMFNANIVYGSDGWADGNHLRAWTEPLRAISRAISLPHGTLRDSIGLMLAVDICGRVWAGNDLAARKCVAQLGQAPAGMQVSSNGSFAIIVGQLHAVIVIFPMLDGRLVMRKHMVPGVASTLTKYHLQLDLLEEDKLQARDDRANRALLVEKKSDTVEFSVIQLGDDEQHEMKSIDDIGKRIGELLNGIERAGALEEALEERGRRAEARLAAFNSALLFALRTRGDNMPLDCTLSGSLTPAVVSPTMNVLPVWTGVNAFVNATLRNRTTVVIGVGWNLRLSVERAPLPDTNNSKHLISERRIESKQVCMPIPMLAAEGETTISFPIALESHAPLVISLELFFVLPNELNKERSSVAGINKEHDLNFIVARDVVLDVFTFSVPAKSATTGPTHQRMRTTLFRQTLLENESSSESLPLSCRLHLPVAENVLQKLAGRRRTLLGADFSIDVTNTDITLRTIPAVLPFLRAAVLRRCIGNVEEVEAGGIEAGERWERRVVDAADDVATEIHEADRAVAECDGLVDAGPETCAVDEDVGAVRRAVAKLDKATTKWRESVGGVWQPNEIEWRS